MKQNYSYLVPAKKARISFTVERSKFIASVFPAQSEEEALGLLRTTEAEFFNATHHAYACRFYAAGGALVRYHDAREPAGSAGLAMLQLLQGQNVFDVLVVATRYFGGVKLGLGGLARAYRNCARLGLQEAGLISREPLTALKLTVSYSDYGPLNTLIEQMQGRILAADYSEEVTVKLVLPERLLPAFSQSFQAVTGGRGIIGRARPFIDRA